MNQPMNLVEARLQQLVEEEYELWTMQGPQGIPRATGDQHMKVQRLRWELGEVVKAARETVQRLIRLQFLTEEEYGILQKTRTRLQDIGDRKPLQLAHPERGRQDDTGCVMS